MSEGCEVCFGSVRCNICETCENLHVSVAAARRRCDATLDQEKEFHLSQANSIYEKLSAHRKTPDPDTLAICMDFDKNCHFLLQTVDPNIISAVSFFMWVHNFGVINIQSGRAPMYI